MNLVYYTYKPSGINFNFMKIDIITIFPSMFEGPFSTSMLKKAQDNKLLELKIHDLRKWAKDPHRSVDDRPYGGGKGMVLMVEPIDNALNELRGKNSKAILLCPQGTTFTQPIARELSEEKHIILIAGHYEGYDERIRTLVDQELSIGNYVLTGGEIPAMVVTDAVARLIPGVLDSEATQKESFSEGTLLDYPTYTRPKEYNGKEVPEILLTGDHAKIEQWRNIEAAKKTKAKQK